MVHGCKKYCLGKHSTWMVHDAQWGSPNGVEGIVIWTGVENFVWTRHRKTLLGPGIKKLCLDQMSKNFVWTGHQKTSFGPGIKKLCLDWASKNFDWTRRQKTSFGPGDKKLRLDGR